jgi:hypothetical protein
MKKLYQSITVLIYNSYVKVLIFLLLIKFCVLRKENIMIIFEVEKNDAILCNEIRNTFGDNAIEASVDALDGYDIVQFIVPLAIVINPSITKISNAIQSYFQENKITIKYDGIEISAMGYKKALKMLNEVIALRNAERDENGHK